MRRRQRTSSWPGGVSTVRVCMKRARAGNSRCGPNGKLQRLQNRAVGQDGLAILGGYPVDRAGAELPFRAANLLGISREFGACRLQDAAMEGGKGGVGKNAAEE